MGGQTETADPYSDSLGSRRAPFPGGRSGVQGLMVRRQDRLSARQLRFLLLQVCTAQGPVALVFLELLGVVIQGEVDHVGCRWAQGEHSLTVTGFSSLKHTDDQQKGGGGGGGQSAADYAAVFRAKTSRDVCFAFSSPGVWYSYHLGGTAMHATILHPFIEGKIARPRLPILDGLTLGHSPA